MDPKETAMSSMSDILLEPHIQAAARGRDAAARQQSRRNVVRVVGAPMIRAASIFLGVVLITSAGGLWLIGSGSWDAEQMLIRLVISMLFLGAGLAVMQPGRQGSIPEVHLDPARGEMVLFQVSATGARNEIARYSYDDLGSVDFRNDMLKATDARGDTLIEMPMAEPGDLDKLQMALGAAFARAV
ncbi:hypothetical protein A9Q95_11265 [Rhodobacterales bacterium 59_46_T64]|nr:hypothetical protein A9Q95_11265 [Rhodobacterales bacterium 59_46_T64]